LTLLMLDPQHSWDFAFRHLTLLRRPYGFDASEAGTGNYAALFGRDSLWMLMFLFESTDLVADPSFRNWVWKACKDALGALAACQGRTTRDEIEEQPGKILHERREHSDARLHSMNIRFEEGLSYSGFDQTFLFVITCCAAAEQLGPEIIDGSLNQAIRNALAWIDAVADDDRDGLLEYRRRNSANLLNQTWRDSFDSLVSTGEDIPPQPIAWLSAQAYAFKAWQAAAAFYERLGEGERAEGLRTKAARLATEVARRFWVHDEDCPVIALDGLKRPIPMISSDAGHALWSGIVDSDRVPNLVRRLMRSDLLTAYGIRTLSAESPFFAPFSYHRGNIWPFDNAVFVRGLLRYEYRTEARLVIERVLAAIKKIGSPCELYIALDGGLSVDPLLTDQTLLLRRRREQENQIQGWTAAGLLYMAAALAHLDGKQLEFRLTNEPP
jgi:glycogen debranching enzyme